MLFCLLKFTRAGYSSFLLLIVTPFGYRSRPFLQHAFSQCCCSVEPSTLFLGHPTHGELWLQGMANGRLLRQLGRPTIRPLKRSAADDRARPSMDASISLLISRRRDSPDERSRLRFGRPSGERQHCHAPMRRPMRPGARRVSYAHCRAHFVGCWCDRW